MFFMGDLGVICILRFSPIPITAAVSPSLVARTSTKIPDVFFPFMRISLGHLTVQSMPVIVFIEDKTANAATIGS